MGLFPLVHRRPRLSIHVAPHQGIRLTGAGRNLRWDLMGRRKNDEQWCLTRKGVPYLETCKDENVSRNAKTEGKARESKRLGKHPLATIHSKAFICEKQIAKTTNSCKTPRTKVSRKMDKNNWNILEWIVLDCIRQFKVMAFDVDQGTWCIECRYAMAPCGSCVMTAYLFLQIVAQSYDMFCVCVTRTHLRISCIWESIVQIPSYLPYASLCTFASPSLMPFIEAARACRNIHSEGFSAKIEKSTV